jgi:hypothetical protein
MTLYLSQYKMHNPLKSRTLTWSRTDLAEEATRKKEEAKASKKAQKHRVGSPLQATRFTVEGQSLIWLQRESLARLEGKESVWRRVVFWLRGFGRKMGLGRDVLRHLEGRGTGRERITNEDEDEDEDEDDNDHDGEEEDNDDISEEEDEEYYNEEGQKVQASADEWRGDWTTILEDYE